MNRLLFQLSEVEETEVVVHSSGNLSTKTYDALSSYNFIKWVHEPQAHEPFSAGYVRNVAVEHATAEYVFFIDVDLNFPASLLPYLVSNTKRLKAIGKMAFEMFPCIYLSRAGTKQFNEQFNVVLDSFLLGENTITDGIAVASSCLLVNKEWFKQLGGFDVEFSGHGGEDLSLIHQLCLHYPVMPLTADYHLNQKAQHPGDYVGCRRYFSFYSLAHLFEGRFFVHYWHSRPLSHKYHQARVVNDELLAKKLKQSSTNLSVVNSFHQNLLQQHCRLSSDLCLMPEHNYKVWMAGLQQQFGYDVAEYPGLFQWRKGVKVHRPLWKKARKLYLNPKLFFVDGLKKLFAK
nr:hypothetical protein [Shewanella gaetbuli]